MKLLFLCTGNSCRSILAEALCNHLAPIGWEARSAGSHPAGHVHPLTLETLRELNIPAGYVCSKPLNALGNWTPDLVITVCDHAALESCPLIDGSLKKVHWPLPDPSIHGESRTDSENRQAFRQVAATIRLRLEALLAKPEPLAHLEELAKIGLLATSPLTHPEDRMTTHPYDALTETGGPGRLLLTPCPGTKGTTVTAAVETLCAAGAKVVITAMPLEELARQGAGTLPDTCRSRGLAWFHLPIADESLPGADFDNNWTAALPDILQRLDQSQDVAIHCLGGSGRTGLIAAKLMIARGIPVETAIARVQSLRPRALRHPDQHHYLETSRKD